jgi:hypothetical protein
MGQRQRLDKDGRGAVLQYSTARASASHSAWKPEVPMPFLVYTSDPTNASPWPPPIPHISFPRILESRPTMVWGSFLREVLELQGTGRCLLTYRKCGAI